MICFSRLVWLLGQKQGFPQGKRNGIDKGSEEYGKVDFMHSVKIVGYKRASTKLQKEDGYSLEHQERASIKYCKDNHLDLVEVYGDEVKSGTNAFAAQGGVFRAGLVAAKSFTLVEVER